MLQDGIDKSTVTHIVSVYLKTGNFTVIPDNGIKESFSNVGVQLMKEAMLLEKTYRVSELVNKVEAKINGDSEDNKNNSK